MDRDAIREFARRDWNATAASKIGYWAERFRKHGWRPAWDAADALLLDMRAIRSDYPSSDEREHDLSSHVRLREQLDRVADALAGR